MKELSANLSDAAKQRLMDTVTGLYNALKKENPNTEITFDNLVKTLIERQSKSVVDDHFLALEKGWGFAKLPEYDSTDFNSVYNKYFSNLVAFENVDSYSEPIYEDRNIKVRYDEELVNKSSILQIEPAKKKDAKSGRNSWLYTKERNVRISWYFILPVAIGLFYGWYFKQPQSFNWTAFFLSSLTFLSLFFLFNKKHRKYLGGIHRDLKIVITTILALLLITLLVATIEFTQYFAEKFSIGESDVLGLSYYVYYIAFLIFAFWESKDDG